MEMANTFLSGNWRDKGPMKMKARKNPMEKCVTTLGAHMLPPICPSGQPVSCMNFPSNFFLFCLPRSARKKFAHKYRISITKATREVFSSVKDETSRRLHLSRTRNKSVTIKTKEIIL